MKAARLLLDTNLLLLLVVGMTSRSYIARHKRLTAFTEQDYDALVDILSNIGEVVLTPHTLTETSNLAAYIQEPAKGQILHTLRSVIAETSEHHVPSTRSAQRPEFLRLGLTDATLIEASAADTVVLTADLDLYLALLSKGAVAENFNHLRDRYL
jgi:hypothetical protein